MPVNNGIIEMFAAAGGAGTGGVDAQIFYDNSIPYDPPNQAIIEVGTPPAACLVTNTISPPVTATVIVTGPTSTQTFQIPTGTLRVRLRQLQQQGINTRADLAGFEMSCP